MKVSIHRVKAVYNRETDPNKLTDDEFQALVALVERVGMIQSITVRKLANGDFEIVDGHHRYWAALAAGLQEISVSVYKGTEDIKAIGLGMNNIRGNPDMKIVTEIVRSLTDEMDTAVMTVLTGFSSQEISDMLADVADIAPDPGDDAGEEPPPKPFLLEILFDDRATYKKVKRLLKKAAGKSGDLAQGILNVLSVDDE